MLAKTDAKINMIIYSVDNPNCKHKQKVTKTINGIYKIKSSLNDDYKENIVYKIYRCQF